MRPRHKTAENVEAEANRKRRKVASMRPRHKTAENDGAGDGAGPPDHPASMRPRHKTAENNLVA